MDDEQALKIVNIFHPHYVAQMEAMRKPGRRFVYYTTAQTAYSIIRNSEIWMRTTSTMNDYLEVEHGLDCLNAALKEPEGKAFRAALDDWFPGLTDRAIAEFNRTLPNIRKDTYIACVSEHLDDEDNNGRLSMWRAYGGHSGVAFVFRADVMLRTDDVGVYASPVAYWHPSQVQLHLAQVAALIKANEELVRSLDEAALTATLFNMFRFAVLCTKHPGFAEEREWRVVTSPVFEQSPLLKQTVEVVRGAPQVVQRLVLKDQPEAGIVGFNLLDMLDRIIIGPCEYLDATYRAMEQLLIDPGASEPRALIKVSKIPLRLPSA